MKVYNEFLGESVEIPDEPERIISLAPNITETLFLLGLEDKIVAVSYFCNKPDEAKKKPRVGSYLKADLEKIKKFEPDLVLTTTGAQRDVNKKLLREGIPVFPIMLPTSVYGILENVWVIGNITNRIEEARKLIESLQERIYRITLNRPKDRLKVYWEICLGGPYTAGAPSHVDSGIYLAGGLNIFHDVRKNYFEPDFSEVARRNPDILIYEQQPTKQINLDKLLEMLRERGLSEINAVKSGRVYVVEPDFFAHYGPSFLDAVEWLNKILLSTR